MLEEYEKLRKKKDGALKVITQRSVDNSRSDVKECEKHLESAQLEYCRLSELDINQRGVGYIAFYPAYLEKVSARFPFHLLSR